VLKDGFKLINGAISPAHQPDLELGETSRPVTLAIIKWWSQHPGFRASAVASLSTALRRDDASAAAQAISGARAQRRATMRTPRRQTGEPNHAGNAGGASVWYA